MNISQDWNQSTQKNTKRNNEIKPFQIVEQVKKKAPAKNINQAVQEQKLIKQVNNCSENTNNWALNLNFKSQDDLGQMKQQFQQSYKSFFTLLCEDIKKYKIQIQKLKQQNQTLIYRYQNTSKESKAMDIYYNQKLEFLENQNKQLKELIPHLKCDSQSHEKYSSPYNSSIQNFQYGANCQESHINKITFTKMEQDLCKQNVDLIYQKRQNIQKTKKIQDLQAKCKQLTQKCKNLQTEKLMSLGVFSKKKYQEKNQTAQNQRRASPNKTFFRKSNSQSGQIIEA